MDDLPFLDTNIVLRHLLGDHPDHSPRATAYLRRVERGEIRLRSADAVVFQPVFVLERSLRFPTTQVRTAVLSVFDLDGIELPNRDRIRRAMALYVDLNLPIADADHAALMADIGSSTVVSFDRDFDRIAWVQRVEP